MSSESKEGGWARIIKPRKSHVWHRVSRHYILSWTECHLLTDNIYQIYWEFADTLPDGARVCKLCAMAKKKAEAAWAAAEAARREIDFVALAHRAVEEDEQTK